jgi:hypothetical protein
LPEIVADQRLALPGISEEAASHEGRDPKHGGELGRHEHALHDLGTLSPFHREAAIRKKEGADLGDAPALLL